MDLDDSDAAPTFQANTTYTAVPPTASPPFGFVISGCPVRTDFTQVDVNKFTCRLSCPGDIPAPLSVASEVALFLLQPLPANHGVLCYWQLQSNSTNAQQATEFELLGALTADQPSRIFYTGWGEHEQVVAAGSAPLTLTIGLSLESTDNITNLQQHSQNHNHTTATTTVNNNGNNKQVARMHVAQKIATDLFQFMQSFDTGTAGAGNMVVPTNIFDRWMKRFENRLARNPNFFLKSSQE